MIRYHKSMALDVAAKRGFPLCKPMTDTKYASMLQDVNINGVQQEAI